MSAGSRTKRTWDNQRSEIIPAGKRLRLEHEAVELAMLLDIRIHRAGERDEIFGPQRALGLQDQDPLVAQQFVMDHVGSSSGCGMSAQMPGRHGLERPISSARLQSLRLTSRAAPRA